MRARAVAILVSVALFPSLTFANCYVLQNNTNSAQTLHFAYSKPLPGAKSDLTLAPHGRFPKTAQLCFNTAADTYATVSIDPGAYTPSWQGTLILGNGTASNGVPAAPSGTYSLQPQTTSQITVPQSASRIAATVAMLKSAWSALLSFVTLLS